MPAQWTAQIIGDLHLYRITAKELAAEVGWHEKYLSRVLNGHVKPKEAECRLKEAMDRLIDRKKNTVLSDSVDI